jgi:site-specific DNA recombinase
VAYKAQQGKTKTRLILDPERGPVVARIFLWRTEQRLGIPAITARLNADHGQYPPPAGGRWLESTVGAILANPKYTGHMVFGRRRKTGRSSVPVSPDRWIWSPEPAHPAIVTRELWDEAQAIGQAHRSASDALASTQPRARRNYPLRSRVRCTLCQRRMCGVTRYTTRDKAADPDARHVYYMCTHDPDQPRHAAAHPDHPRTLSIRQDILLEQIRQLFATRIFGPERRALLAAQIPETEAQAAAQADRQRDALTKDLARIDLAQRSQILQIESLTTDPADRAARAMRARCNERFAELHAQRETTENQLTALDATAPAQDGNADLLDPLPLLAGIIDQIPARLQAALYQAFDIQCLYRKDKNQVSIYATITTSTPRAVAAILADAGNDPANITTPAQPPTHASPAIYPSPQPPIGEKSTTRS